MTTHHQNHPLSGVVIRCTDDIAGGPLIDFWTGVGIDVGCWMCDEPTFFYGVRGGKFKVLKKGEVDGETILTIEQARAKYDEEIAKQPIKVVEHEPKHAF